MAQGPTHPRLGVILSPSTGTTSSMPGSLPASITNILLLPTTATASLMLTFSAPFSSPGCLLASAVPTRNNLSWLGVSILAVFQHTLAGNFFILCQTFRPPSVVLFSGQIPVESGTLLYVPGWKVELCCMCLTIHKDTSVNLWEGSQIPVESRTLLYVPTGIWDPSHRFTDVSLCIVLCIVLILYCFHLTRLLYVFIHFLSFNRHFHIPGLSLLKFTAVFFFFCSATEEDHTRWLKRLA